MSSRQASHAGPLSTILTSAFPGLSLKPWLRLNYKLQLTRGCMSSTVARSKYFTKRACQKQADFSIHKHIDVAMQFLHKSLLASAIPFQEQGLSFKLYQPVSTHKCSIFHSRNPDQALSCDKRIQVVHLIAPYLSFHRNAVMVIDFAGSLWNAVALETIFSLQLDRRYGHCWGMQTAD